MKINKLIILFLSFAMFSCTSDLDIIPVENNVSNTFYSSELEVNQAAIGIYSRLGRSGSNQDFPTLYYLLVSEDRSDIRYLVGETSAQNDQLDIRKYLLTSSTTTVSTIFARLYSMIADANNLLSKTPENEYVRYRAEACFLRAYAYSELVRAFGPVSLVTKPIENGAAVLLPREPIETIYAQIIEDLNYAGANLDEVYTGKSSGRVGSLAAKALLGQVYMTMAGSPLKDASAMVKAESVYAQIIDKVSARFATNYADIFTLRNENKYDLFSVQFASGGFGTGSSLPGYITSSGSGASPFPEWVYSSYGQQGQDLRVDTLLVNEMKLNNDKRLPASVDMGFWNSLDAQKRVWVVRNVLTKFLEKDNTNTTIKSWNDFPRNFPIIRPAEVLLYYAEALIANSKPGDAAKYINKIRSRAGLADLTTIPTLDDIKKERKYEFIGEGKRYFDLVRWGESEAVATLAAFAKYYHSETNGIIPTKRDLLLPIPDDEMKTRTNWVQNFGY
ncbi:putative outer membrane starch-binding protein [Dysgonomonas alginatilytica]|uniref:Putative outer membrane starch-binding protein n=1 Tax=Dysgonomonas alginatilytica TaxID=1605892 RepID=A0A2V3PT76_9BACT|nr:RagB/SusD family nutrient uptake outer membrane protein [Dysgonomonas alginatilytica]PXV65880.1 putative outer membrane starch-binding protein [Dysgonomonas alginatilytica]